MDTKAKTDFILSEIDNATKYLTLSTNNDSLWQYLMGY